MWLSVFFLYAAQQATGFPDQSIVTLRQSSLDRHLEIFRVPETNWVLVSADFGDATKSKYSESDKILLKGSHANNFLSLEPAVWEAFRTKFQDMINQCFEQSRSSGSLTQVLRSLSSVPIVFTLGEQAETLGPRDTRIGELISHPDLQQVAHITLNLEELDHSYVYSIKTKRTVNFKNDRSSDAVTDCYLLEPFLQPAYMVLAHELLHILLDRQNITVDFPPDEWQNNPILWSQHFDARAELPVPVAYEKALKKLWTSTGEIGVIIGFPGRREIITENMIKGELRLPLRALHKGPSNEERASCLYEPCQYMESTMSTELLRNIPSGLPLSEDDYYALGKVYGRIPTSRKGSSGIPTPNVSETGVGHNSEDDGSASTGTA